MGEVASARADVAAKEGGGGEVAAAKVAAKVAAARVKVAHSAADMTTVAPPPLARAHRPLCRGGRRKWGCSSRAGNVAAKKGAGMSKGNTQGSLALCERRLPPKLKKLLES